MVYSYGDCAIVYVGLLGWIPLSISLVRLAATKLRHAWRGGGPTAALPPPPCGDLRLGSPISLTFSWGGLNGPGARDPPSVDEGGVPDQRPGYMYVCMNV